MTAHLRIEYVDGSRITEITRPVGPEWSSFTRSGPTREDLATALDAAKAELLDAAHPKEDRRG